MTDSEVPLSAYRIDHCTQRAVAHYPKPRSTEPLPPPLPDTAWLTWNPPTTTSKSAADNYTEKSPATKQSHSSSPKTAELPAVERPVRRPRHRGPDRQLGHTDPQALLEDERAAAYQRILQLETQSIYAFRLPYPLYLCEFRRCHLWAPTPGMVPRPGCGETDLRPLPDAGA